MVKKLVATFINTCNELYALGVRMHTETNRESDNVMWLDVQVARTTQFDINMTLRINTEDETQVASTIELLEELPKLVRSFRGLMPGEEE